MFKVYAFSESASWSVDASTLEEANALAATFQQRDLKVRIYSQSVNQSGDVVERLVGSSL